MIHPAHKTRIRHYRRCFGARAIAWMLNLKVEDVEKELRRQALERKRVRK